MCGHITVFVCVCVWLKVRLHGYVTSKVAQNDQIGLVFISYLISFIVESVSDLNTSIAFAVS